MNHRYALDGIEQSRIFHRLTATGASFSYCGPGWVRLLDRAETRFRAIDKLGTEKVQIETVRSTIGILAISFARNQHLTEQQWKESYRLSIEIEKASMEICEACGASAELRHRGNWFNTVCWTCDPHPANVPVQRPKSIRILEG